jgi:hypothetical protein
MKENDRTTRRVVVVPLGPTSSRILTAVPKIRYSIWLIPVDLFASQNRVDTLMQSCIPEYNGQRDYEAIVKYLLPTRSIALQTSTNIFARSTD